MKHDDKQHTTAWIGDVLDREADALDATTRARLARMRQEALDGPRPVVRFAWVTAGAFAAAGLLAISLVFFHQPGAIGGDVLEEMELLSDEHDPEFYMDIAFYEWLDREHPDAG